MHGSILTGMEKPREAAASFSEAPEAISPVLLTLPEAMTQLIKELLKYYFQSADSVGIEPEMELLGPIIEKLGETGAIELTKTEVE